MPSHYLKINPIENQSDLRRYIMSQMFYPKMSVHVHASAPHPEGTEYKISIGEEDWDGNFKTVIKVQMLYHGKVAGRKSPSYPVGTDDAQRVAKAIAEIEEKYHEQQAEAKRVVFYPEKPVTYIPVGQYLALLFSIPDGYLTTWEAIEHYFERVYGAEKVAVEIHAHWPAFVNDREVPYWKVIGTTGFLHDDRSRCPLETQAKKLRERGFIVELAGKGKQSLKVRNYKQYFFDLSKIDSDIITHTDIPSKTKTDAIWDVMANPEYYKSFSKDSLIQIIKDYSVWDDNEKMLKCVEHAKNELVRRGFDLKADLK